MHTSPAVLVILITLKIVDNAPIARWEKNLICAEVPSTILEGILGGAFNPRYMSVNEPTDDETPPGAKRDSSYVQDFYVDDKFFEEVDPAPAWYVENHVAIAKRRQETPRRKRSTEDYSQQWSCRSKLEWTDLGPDYFPRYLRSVVCLSEKCWYGFFKCKPRSFTVKLLRRKKGFCARGADNFNKIGMTGLPQELKEMWVWEERAVNFCCDCTR